MKKLIFLLITLVLLTSTASAGYTLTVGPHEKYKTIQSAMYAADDGATINVKPGIYKENVEITREIFIYGKGYPTVYGFYSNSAGLATINGFKIIKNGINFKNGGDNCIRNNYFYNCGVNLNRCWLPNTIMNNKFSRGGIVISSSANNSVAGNTIDKAAIGLRLINGASCDTISKNKFQYCNIGVQVPAIPKCLIGNSYKGNKINIKIVKK